MLSGKQRAALAALANKEDAILQIGKGGLGENLFTQVDDALEARELIKLKVLETAGISAREAAEAICRECGCEVVQTIGARLVLYRRSKTKNRIQI